MAGLTLDSGPLLAAEKHERRLWILLKHASIAAVKVTVPAVVVAQAWRGNHAAVAPLLAGCDVEPMDDTRARAVGRLLKGSKTKDIVDAAVVLGASFRRDAVVTSDPDDILGVARAMGVQLKVIRG